jgi:hypothetical protein
MARAMIVTNVLTSRTIYAIVKSLIRMVMATARQIVLIYALRIRTK